MKIEMNNKTKPAVCTGIAAAAAVFAISLHSARRSGEDAAYNETKAENGSVTKEPAAEIGTLEQIFDVELRADDQALEVSDVLITVGQEIKKGGSLYALTAESVDKARAELLADIEDAKADYKALEASQEARRTQAGQEYDTYAINGKYAQFVYENELKPYQEAVDEAVQLVSGKQNAYNEKKLKLLELQNKHNEARKLLREAEAAVSENYAGRHDNAYYYALYLNTRNTAQELNDRLKEEIDSTNDEIEQLSLDIQSAVRTMNQCQRDYEKAKIELGQTKAIDAYHAGIASEWRSIQTTSLDNELSLAKMRCEAAAEKLAAFDRRVQGGIILSEYSGVVIDIHLSKGDMLSGGSSLVTVNDGKTRE